MKNKIILIIFILFVLFISGCVQEEEYCVKIDSNERMSLTEAKQIALTNECGDRLKETYICNEVTGTWWIDLDIEKEMCNPACVVNVETKQAEINWRCTGLIN